MIVRAVAVRPSVNFGQYAVSYVIFRDEKIKALARSEFGSGVKKHTITPHDWDSWSKYKPSWAFKTVEKIVWPMKIEEVHVSVQKGGDSVTRFKLAKAPPADFDPVRDLFIPPPQPRFEGFQVAPAA
ncbi:hypothetical protein CTA1_7977 [Colletotrichum tanaceti]|uniref:Uncharacterized protein n=1 Tax=Colletotrichum tanaceti TaxID=1306861 RepID=A0A4U6XN28_9PEZI|nr:hypothetical protein CTA1_7977 [Colletotrichum tanaceti]